MTRLLEYRRYRLPFRTPVRTAHGWWREREGLLVRLESDAGMFGYGEAAPIPWFGTETVDEAEAGCRELGGRVDAARIASVPVRLGCLRNALAAAGREAGRVSDPAGKSADKEGRVKDPPYVAVAALLPAGRAVLAAVEPLAEIGFRVFKWKVGVGDLADELGLLDDLCAALPDGAVLRLDANGAWDRRKAERWLTACAERPVEFVEQPIAAEARGASDALLGLARDFPTALALDESLIGDGDVERWLGAGWPGVFVIKPSLLADPAAALARLAEAKADVVFSSALETALGARAALEAALAWPGARRAVGYGVWPLFVDGRFDGPYGGPFLRAEEIERMNPEAVWNALS